MYSQISTVGGTYAPVSGMHRLMLMKLAIVTHYQVYMAVVTF